MFAYQHARQRVKVEGDGGAQCSVHLLEHRRELHGKGSHFLGVNGIHLSSSQHTSACVVQPSPHHDHSGDTGDDLGRFTLVSTQQVSTQQIRLPSYDSMHAHGAGNNCNNTACWAAHGCHQRGPQGNVEAVYRWCHVQWTA